MRGLTMSADEDNNDKNKGKIDSKYRLIHVAAKRARQIQQGSPPQVESDTTKATKRAMDEVKAGKVEWSIPDKEKSAAEKASEALDGNAEEKKLDE
jgi:DNA-directed RNA polymerase subunit omega